MREPLLHTNITDELPWEHPLAREALWCKRCDAMLHASNNECMQPWVETGGGPFCVPCFAAVYDETDDPMVLALPDEIPAAGLPVGEE